MPEALMAYEALDKVNYTAPTVAKSAGEVVQLADGRAGVITMDIAAAGVGSAYVAGIFTVAKTTSMVVLEGQRLYWDSANSKVKYTGDFLVGVAAADATAAATTVDVHLNVDITPLISLTKGVWTKTETLGTGVTLYPPQEYRLQMDAVAEASTQALYAVDTVACALGPIMEAWIAVYDIGDDAALDICIGLANGTHATDFDAVTEYVIAHLDGTDLSVLVESEDGTTTVAPTDSTVDLVDDTKAFLQIDTRNLADIKIYLNGVDLGALAAVTLNLAAATGPVLPIFHVEKTNNDTVADVRVYDAHVRTATTV